MNPEIDALFHFQITPAEAIGNLLVALVCGIFIAYIYKTTYRGINYSANYVISIIMLTMITALVIMVIGNNLARAFGLVGAMSIIRFRTAVKDTQDIMFIFFALAVGLASGASMYAIALVGTLFIGIASWAAININNENPKKKEYLLQVYTDYKSNNSSTLDKTLTNYCKKYSLVNLKTVGLGESQQTESSFYIQFKKMNNAPTLIQELNKIEGVKKVNLFFDED